MPVIEYRVDQAVAVISFANPPVNGLSHTVRAGISGDIRVILSAAKEPCLNA
jgi:hypothetical protein